MRWICQAMKMSVNRISDYLLDPTGKQPGHITFQWRFGNVTTIGLKVVFTTSIKPRLLFSHGGYAS